LNTEDDQSLLKSGVFVPTWSKALSNAREKKILAAAGRVLGAGVNLNDAADEVESGSDVSDEEAGIERGNTSNDSEEGDED
jgi:hypothetical protein